MEYIPHIWIKMTHDTIYLFDETISSTVLPRKNLFACLI